jgi:hypothetical protein
MHVQDIVLDPILTTSEVVLAVGFYFVLHLLILSFQLYHPFKTIQRYLLDSVCHHNLSLVYMHRSLYCSHQCPEAMVAVMHDDDLTTLMDEVGLHCFTHTGAPHS